MRCVTAENDAVTLLETITLGPAMTYNVQVLKSLFYIRREVEYNTFDIITTYL